MPISRFWATVPDESIPVSAVTPPSPPRPTPTVDKFPLLQLSPRHCTRGFFGSISSERELEPLVEAFVSLGVPITPQIIDALKFAITENLVEGTNATVYLGTDNDDVFSLVSSRGARNVERINLLSIKSDDDFVYTMNDYSYVQCETVEMARVFLSRANNLDYKRPNGTNWIDEEGGFPYPYGSETCYRLQTGDIVEKSLSGFNETTAQNVLYNLNTSLERFVLKEGHIFSEDLVVGRIYKRVLTTSVIFFKHKRFPISEDGARDYYDGVSDNGEFLMSCFRLIPSDHRERFVLCTEEEKAVYRRGWADFQNFMLERRREDKIRFAEERRQKLYNAKNNIDTYNRDVETQLFSESFHKVLTKALDNKVARSLLKLNKMGYFDGSTRNITIRRSDKRMTYSPSGKKTVMTEDNVWNAKGRQDGKYGKVIRKILKEQVPRLIYKDSEIEQLVNHLKAESADGDFSTVKGADILDWYDGSNYADDELTGTLAHSCMRSSDCRHFMDIYAENPNQVKMVILVKDEELMGRAILWNDKWMDRIYGSDATIKAFRNFAKEKGYHCKATQGSSPEDGWVNPETGATYNEFVTVNLDKSEFDRYPYADTFCYIDVGNKQMGNDYRSLSCYSEMRDTGGYLEGEGTIYDEYTGEDIPEEDSVYLDYLGYSTHYDNVRECDVDGENYLHDDMVSTWDDCTAYEDNVIYVSSEQAYATEEQIFRCDHDGEDYIQGLHDEVYVEELDMHVMEDNVRDAYEDNDYHFIDDEWRSRETLESDEDYHEVDGEWELVE